MLELLPSLRESPLEQLAHPLLSGVGVDPGKDLKSPIRSVDLQPCIGGSRSASVSVVPAMNATATALIQGVTMHWHESGRPNSEAIYQGRPTVLAVGYGGEMEARFVFNAADARRIESIEKFWVEIKYTDAAGGQPEITRLDIYQARGT